MENQPSLPHFLVVTYPAQGHINPSLRLAKRLSLLAPAGSAITFSTALSAHRLMFPSSPDQPVDEGLISFIPYSNGYDAGFDPRIDDVDHHLHQLKHHGSITLSFIITSLASSRRRRPITCIIYSSFLSWVADLATDLRIPSFLFWIQPTTAFAAYWHYFNHYHAHISASASDPSAFITLPHLPPMRARDLPSFIAITSPDHPDAKLLPHLKEAFVRNPKLRVIANSSVEIEPMAFESVSKEVEIVGIGPLVGETGVGSLVEEDEAGEKYMYWLDEQEERSVVYVSFGSMVVMGKEEVENIERVLRESGRPYLWVVRKESTCVLDNMEEGRGKVLRWCKQERVLGHKAVGCFVTHCGWNSTVEGLMCGVPMVAVPRWTDQTTNAWLMEQEWGTALRVEVKNGGAAAGAAEEMIRCVEVVMGEEGKWQEMRRSARQWKEKVRGVVEEGGSSDVNIKAFVEVMCR